MKTELSWYMWRFIIWFTIAIALLYTASGVFGTFWIWTSLVIIALVVAFMVLVAHGIHSLNQIPYMEFYAKQAGWGLAEYDDDSKQEVQNIIRCKGKDEEGNSLAAHGDAGHIICWACCRDHYKDIRQAQRRASQYQVWDIAMVISVTEDCQYCCDCYGTALEPLDI